MENNTNKGTTMQPQKPARKWSISFHSDIVRRGYDEDGGEMFGECACLIAEDAKGFRHAGPCIGTQRRWTADEAEAAVATFVAAHPNFDPTTHQDWSETSPCYGSEAWGPEAEYELAFGIDSFRNRWQY
jgi:hypothetical protein